MSQGGSTHIRTFMRECVCAHQLYRYTKLLRCLDSICGLKFDYDAISAVKMADEPKLESIFSSDQFSRVGRIARV
jgi:hypothetical protein